MPRVNIYFDDDTYKELKEYKEEKYGQHKALSLIVQLAVKEFLEAEKAKLLTPRRPRNGD